jgi:hypothetical protein
MHNAHYSRAYHLRDDATKELQDSGLGYKEPLLIHRAFESYAP